MTPKQIEQLPGEGLTPEQLAPPEARAGERGGAAGPDHRRPPSTKVTPEEDATWSSMAPTSTDEESEGLIIRARRQHRRLPQEERKERQGGTKTCCTGNRVLGRPDPGQGRDLGALGRARRQAASPACARAQPIPDRHARASPPVRAVRRRPITRRSPRRSDQQPFLGRRGRPPSAVGAGAQGGP